MLLIHKWIDNPYHFALPKIVMDKYTGNRSLYEVEGKDKILTPHTTNGHRRSSSLRQEFARFKISLSLSQGGLSWSNYPSLDFRSPDTGISISLTLFQVYT
jgi:hypothetical protein